MHKHPNWLRRESYNNMQYNKKWVRDKLSSKNLGNNKTEIPKSNANEAKQTPSPSAVPKSDSQQGKATSEKQDTGNIKQLESQMMIPEQNGEGKTVSNTQKNAEPEGKQPLNTSKESSIEDRLETLDPVEEVEDDEFNKDDFLTTIFENMEPYMDTYSVYQQLISAGFKPSQADEIINLLIVQLNSKLSKLSTKYSQVYELENERYLFESAQQELRVDITRSRELHINELINLINILERDFNIISDELNNDFIQMKNDSQVAMNDQNSENTLHAKKIRLRIQETNHKITTELNSAMRSEIESLRWHISRWGLMAILMSVFSGCTVFYVHKVKTMKQLQSANEFVPLVIYEPSEYDEDDYHTDLDESLIN